MLFWSRPDLMRHLDTDTIDLASRDRIRLRRREKLSRPYHARQAETLIPLPTARELNGPIQHDLNSEHVTIGRRNDLTADQHSLLTLAVTALQPWRKGPFRLFGHEIDAEWRSNRKWDRINPALGDLRGRTVLDVGCGNGYYMFRCAGLQPAAVLGIDPSIPFYLAFELMQRYLCRAELQYDLLGVEDLHVFNQTFDVALCMGILYHHRSPLVILKRLLQSIRVGGFAVIESQTIPGSGSIALFPEERYAKAQHLLRANRRLPDQLDQASRIQECRTRFP